MMNVPNPAESKWLDPWAGRWAMSTRRALGLLLGLAGLGILWLALTWPGPPASPAPHTILPLDDPGLVYSPGWRISPEGADPAEPADPWRQPAGVVTFTYTGQDLALALAQGDFWAYLLVTVDGEPANRLPTLDGATASQGQPAGYRPLLAPEAQGPDGPSPIWVTVHRADDSGPHLVRMEVWRGWSQTPLRGIAVDGLPQPGLPVWPGMALLILAGGVGLAALRPSPLLRPLGWLPRFSQGMWAALQRGGPLLALIGAGSSAAGMATGQWLFSLAGLGLLALGGLARPALWLAALLFGLPFYLIPLPLLPGRGLNLVEVGVYGGLVILAAHRLLSPQGWTPERSGALRGAHLLGLWAGVALIAVCAYPLVDGHFFVALREWRTVFLAGALFGLLLALTLAHSPRAKADRDLLLLAWVAGGAGVSMIGLLNYVNGEMVVVAEGVDRLRSVYGSPNNLALYVERTLLLCAGFALLGGAHTCGQPRWVWLSLGLVQGIALLLTFSKGALFLGLPVGVGVLAVGGWRLGRAGKRSRWGLLWLGAAGLALALALLPFLGTERFRAMLDLSQGSTGFFRVQLWRSAWQMALDHPLWGVGPDNFLYAYRSGYILPSAWQEPHLNHPHNLLLDLWLRVGLPGLVVAGAWLGLSGRTWLAQLRWGKGEEPIVALSLLAAAAGALAHGLIDISYALPDLMLAWVLLGLGIGDWGLGIGQQTPKAQSLIPNPQSLITAKSPQCPPPG